MKQSAAPVRWMTRLTEGLDFGDLLTILNWKENQHRVKRYDPLTKSMVDDSAIPWPIKWLILRRHRKHIFQSRGLPSMERVRLKVTDFANRIKWRWYYQQYPPEAVDFTLPRSSRVAPFCPEHSIGTNYEWRMLDRWLTSVKKRLLDAVRKSRSAH
eukprot:2166369-Pyramimonas_sp.AAC.1